MRTSGKLTNGLVHIIQIAFSLPSFKASNISVADNPALAEILTELFQKFSTSFLSLASSKFLCAGNKFESPPTSRPPIALGCPVKENGPAPDLPMLPVMRCKLIRLKFLLTPMTD